MMLTEKLDAQRQRDARSLELAAEKADHTAAVHGWQRHAARHEQLASSLREQLAAANRREYLSDNARKKAAQEHRAALAEVAQARQRAESRQHAMAHNYAHIASELVKTKESLAGAAEDAASLQSKLDCATAAEHAAQNARRDDASAHLQAVASAKEAADRAAAVQMEEREQRLAAERKLCDCGRELAQSLALSARLSDMNARLMHDKELLQARSRPAAVDEIAALRKRAVSAEKERETAVLAAKRVRTEVARTFAERLSRARARGRVLEKRAALSAKRQQKAQTLAGRVVQMNDEMDEMNDTLRAAQGRTVEKQEWAVHTARRSIDGRFQSAPWQLRALELAQLARRVPCQFIAPNIIDVLMIYAPDKVVNPNPSHPTFNPHPIGSTHAHAHLHSCTLALTLACSGHSTFLRAASANQAR